MAKQENKGSKGSKGSKPKVKEVKSKIPGARKAVEVLVDAGVLASSDANALYSKIRKNLT